MANQIMYPDNTSKPGFATAEETIKYVEDQANKCPVGTRVHDGSGVVYTKPDHDGHEVIFEEKK